MVAFNTPLTHTDDYVFGRGVCFFAPFDANGVPMGERDLGNTPGVTLTVTSEKAEHFSSRTGLRLKDLSVTISVAFDSTITLEDISADNLALFVAGASATVTQAAAGVTNERIYNAQSGKHYQLGTSTTVITGVRGVTSVTIGCYELINAAARANSTAVVVGQIFKSGTDVFVVSVAGTTAGSAPTYDVAIVGNDTTDGTATVLFLGTTSNYTLTTDYILSAGSARVGIVVGGNLGLACIVYTTVSGLYLSLNANYTKDANTRTQITSTGAGSVTGQFRFVADNANGTNRDFFIADCTLSADGELPLITENEVAQFTFTLGINERDTSTPQVIIDGRVV